MKSEKRTIACGRNRDGLVVEVIAVRTDCVRADGMTLLILPHQSLDLFFDASNFRRLGMIWAIKLGDEKLPRNCCAKSRLGVQCRLFSNSNRDCWLFFPAIDA